MVKNAITKAAIATPKLVESVVVLEEEEPDETVWAIDASEYGNGMLGFTTKFAINWKFGEPKPIYK